MAGILQNVFSKGIYTLKVPGNVSKIKTLVNHSALYFGQIVYTVIGGKVGKPNSTRLTNTLNAISDLPAT